MDELEVLTPGKCILLAVSAALEADIHTLQQLTRLRPDVLQLELVLRILLTYLPETLDPAIYTAYLSDIGLKATEAGDTTTQVKLDSVKDLEDGQVSARVRGLRLLPLNLSSTPSQLLDNFPLDAFLIHRSYRIERTTGLLTYIPKLVTPFVDRSPYLANWYCSTVLPLLRHNYEYYPEAPFTASLEDFELLDGSSGVDVLLRNTEQSSKSAQSSLDDVGRDLRGLVSPWVRGNNRRKRRKLAAAEAVPDPTLDDQQSPGHEWEPVFDWIASTNKSNYRVGFSAIDGWDGPEDADLGGLQDSEELSGWDEATNSDLRQRYRQIAFAMVYSVDDYSLSALEAAYGVLVRLADLLDQQPPLPLSVSAEQLPQCTFASESPLLEHIKVSHFQSEFLYGRENPLTAPSSETFSFLRAVIFSARQLASLGQSFPLSKIAKLALFGNAEEQTEFLQTITRALGSSGKKSEDQWLQSRARLLWSRAWSHTSDHTSSDPSTELTHRGVFWRLPESTIEKEFLTTLCKHGSPSLAAQLYLSEGGACRGSLEARAIETTIIQLIEENYDSASNGNKTRGAMKRALDLITTFKPYFPHSTALQRLSALIEATHSMSFYSLTLTPGVPFKPASIRRTADPIEDLLPRMLEQNPRSYTHLDNLISIGKHLALSTPSPPSNATTQAEHRIISLAITAALHEDDFQTAYSYVVNRLNTVQLTRRPSQPLSNPSISLRPPNPDRSPDAHEDSTWRAAYLAGRFRSSTPAHPTQRDLEQRMDLLSTSLLLAPPRVLPEILAAWRKCEEELLTLHSRETDAERAWNDAADTGRVRVSAPGGLDDVAWGRQPELLKGQPRRELGRAPAEAPMGLFDVARGAAAAFGRTSSAVSKGLREAGGATGEASAEPDEAESARQRVRKRDMVANAVTGGLASGIGWVLGAPPVRDQ